jgi:hypothetical protein
MARHSVDNLLDVEIMQELQENWFSDTPSDCESDRSSTDGDGDDDLGPPVSQKGKKGRG